MKPLWTLSGGGDNTFPIIVGVAPVNAFPQFNGQVQFTAKVFGNKDQAVTWSIDPPLGSIDQTGLYTAPDAGSTINVAVKACSQLDSARCATAAVTLPAVPFSAVMAGFTD